MINSVNTSAINIHTNLETDNKSDNSTTNTKKTNTASGNITLLGAAVGSKNIDLPQILTDNSPVQILQPPKANFAENMQGTSEALGNISEPEVILDITAMLMLFQKLAQEKRTSANKVRAAESEMEKQAYLESAQKIREAAQDRMIGAITGASLQIAGSLTQLAIGAKGFKDISDAIKNDKSITNTLKADAIKNAPNSDEISNALQSSKLSEAILLQARKADGLAESASTISASIGKMAQASMDRDASIKDAQKAELDLQARMHEKASQSAKEEAQQMLEIIRDMRNLIQAENQARKDTRILL